VRKAATGPLKNRTTFQNLGDAIALEFFAGLFLPGVNPKRGAIQSGQGPGDAGLKTRQVGFGGIKVKGGAHGKDL
jgi:hypothetical protein